MTVALEAVIVFSLTVLIALAIQFSHDPVSYKNDSSEINLLDLLYLLFFY